MQVQIPNKKLKRSIEDVAERVKRFGADLARKIRLRMGALVAAESLADFWPSYSGSERCHELKADLAGTFSIDLKHPYRLLFRPSDSSNKVSAADEKQRWQAINSIQIIGIEDTHG
jgi:proteic killer suppression protein